MSANTALGIGLDDNETLLLRLLDVVYITVHHDDLQLDRPYGTALVTSVAIGTRDDRDPGLTAREARVLRDWAHIKFGKVDVEIM